MPTPPRLSRALLFATATAAASAVGCSAPDRGDGPLGEAVQASDGICNNAPAASLDGFPAYPWCNDNGGQFDVYTDNGIDTESTDPGGWSETGSGSGYGCVEFAVRYFYFQWNVPRSWSVQYAKDMCDTYPSGVSITSSPVHGDLAVMMPGCDGGDPIAGRVLAIDSITGAQFIGVQQNPAAAYTLSDACVKCYLHAANNGTTQDPCAAAQSDGYYCGQSTKPGFGPGTTHDLYLCQNGMTASKTPCQYGCNIEPLGQDDACNPDLCTTAPVDGSYCGQSFTWGGPFDGATPDVLYVCQGSTTVSTTPCPYGCSSTLFGTNDWCNPAPSGSGGSSSTSTSASTTGTSTSSGGGAGGAGGAGGSGGSGAGGAGGAGGAHPGSSGTGGVHTGGTGTGPTSGTGGAGAEPPGSTQKWSGCAVGGASGPDGRVAILVGLVAAGLGLRRRRS